MITKMSITEIEAKKNLGKRAKGFDVTFTLEDIKIAKEEVRIKFSYKTSYKEDAGHILIRGELLATEDRETIKKIEEGLKAKKLPAEYMQKIVNAVNYFGTTNAAVISTVLNTMPPIKMPVLQFRQGQKGQTPAKKEE